MAVRFRRTSCFTLPLAVAAFAFAHVAAAEGAGANVTVYKCRQANGAISYQDYACKGGVAVDIKPDAADPAAIRRLQRAQAEFDRSAAQRKADEANAAIRREQSNQRRREVDTLQSISDSEAGDVGYGLGYGVYVPHAHARVNREKSQRRAEYLRRVPVRRVPAVIRRPPS